ncbi:hypothetical protein BKD02_13600 [Brucella sp. 09RB8910]|nr:hypothetical protein BKD02_13600 [Brucella sp. 09RB8910]
MQENFPRCDKGLSWRGMMRVIVEEVKKTERQRTFLLSDETVRLRIARILFPKPGPAFGRYVLMPAATTACCR